jgi:hypothetical protein
MTEQTRSKSTALTAVQTLFLAGAMLAFALRGIGLFEFSLVNTLSTLLTGQPFLVAELDPRSVLVPLEDSFLNVIEGSVLALAISLVGMVISFCWPLPSASNHSS